MSPKKWFYLTMGCFMTMIIGLASLIIWVDPCFHYHKPLNGLQYPMDNERYQNDGIVKHFSYEAIITGTSMTQNFKASQFEALFDVNTIKVPFSGGGLQEIAQNLERAFQKKSDIQYVLWGIDYNFLEKSYDWKRYDSYPEYLYDNIVWNDTQYILNKTILLKTWNVLKFTKNGGITSTFDEYMAWDYPTGKDVVLRNYSRGEQRPKKSFVTEADIVRVRESIQRNIGELVKKYPDTQFLFFFTPYSIVYWDGLYLKNSIEWMIGMEEIAIEELLTYPNVKLYSFFNHFELICNLDNYKDSAHYNASINEWILEKIAGNEFLLTKENYEEYLNSSLEFYTNFPYDEYIGEYLRVQEEKEK